MDTIINRKEFFEAIQSGEQARAEEMIDLEDQLVDAVDENGLSAVLTAVYHNQPGIAERLIERGAHLNIFECAATGQLARLRQLVDAEPGLVNSFAADGFQPLGLAAFFGRVEVTRFLLERGAEVNSASKNRLNVMPLHSAVANNQLEISRLLLEHGAGVDARQEQEITPLHEAAQNGDMELVLLLLEHGADRLAKMSGGLTAADLARQQGHFEVVHLLVGSSPQ
jgi:uncharacterized protein